MMCLSVLIFPSVCVQAFYRKCNNFYRNITAVDAIVAATAHIQSTLHVCILGCNSQME